MHPSGWLAGWVCGWLVGWRIAIDPFSYRIDLSIYIAIDIYVEPVEFVFYTKGHKDFRNTTYAKSLLISEGYFS